MQALHDLVAVEQLAHLRLRHKIYAYILARLGMLFGNALDNAIEAVAPLPEGERTISLVVRRVAGVISIHVENPCSAEPTLRTDGLPETTKGDRTNHGFGVRSMRLTVERYGGTLTTLAEGGRFHVNAIVPL